MMMMMMMMMMMLMMMMMMMMMMIVWLAGWFLSQQRKSIWGCCLKFDVLWSLFFSAREMSTPDILAR